MQNYILLKNDRSAQKSARFLPDRSHIPAQQQQYNVPPVTGDQPDCSRLLPPPFKPPRPRPPPSDKSSVDNVPIVVYHLPCSSSCTHINHTKRQARPPSSSSEKQGDYINPTTSFLPAPSRVHRAARHPSIHLQGSQAIFLAHHVRQQLTYYRDVTRL